MTEKSQNTSLVREANGTYRVTRPVLNEDEILSAAEAIIARRFYRLATVAKPEDAVAFLRSQLALQKREVFGGLFLDNRHRVIAWELLFFGTIDGCSVFPREVVKQALAHNAAAVIFAHPHPSGIAEPSAADVQITKRLRDALALVEVRVLDHIVIGASDTVSMTERGLI